MDLKTKKLLDAFDASARAFETQFGPNVKDKYESDRSALEKRIDELFVNGTVEAELTVLQDEHYTAMRDCLTRATAYLTTANEIIAELDVIFDADDLISECERVLASVPVALAHSKRERELEAALAKARDTFRETATAMHALGRTLVAEAMQIAADASDEVLRRR